MKEEEINRRVTWAFVIEEGFKKKIVIEDQPK